MKKILFSICLTSIYLNSYSQLTSDAKTTIKDIFYGVDFGASSLKTYNTLNNHTDCYDVLIWESKINVQAKSKSSKHVKISNTYSFPYILMTFKIRNEVITERMFELYEEKNMDNFNKLNTMFELIASNVEKKEYIKKDIIGDELTNCCYEYFYFDKTGNNFAKLTFEKSIQGWDNRCLTLYVFDSEIK